MLLILTPKRITLVTFLYKIVGFDCVYNLRSPRWNKVINSKHYVNINRAYIPYTKERKYLRINREPGFDLTEEEMRTFKIWPQGIVPYFIDDFSFGHDLANRIRVCLDSINALTGLNFIELFHPPEDQKSRWVLFVNRIAKAECVDYSHQFTYRGVQKVVLGYDCLRNVDDLASLVLALAGVPPQHNAPDRDDFITIQFDNIIPDKRTLFTKLPDNVWLFHNVPYDFDSAGHYEFHKYTANGHATIEPKNTSLQQVVNAIEDERQGFSSSDVMKIKMLYNFISGRKNTTLLQCAKIYKPGTKLIKVKPDDKNVIPRIKPNKYLGIKYELKPVIMKFEQSVTSKDKFVPYSGKNKILINNEVKNIESPREVTGFIKGFNDRYDDLRHLSDYFSSVEGREDRII